MEYKSNSHKSKEQQTEEKELVIRQVTTGKTSMKKEPISRKFADTFLSESMTNVKLYLINDVLIPTIKDTFVELVNNGSSMLVYGSPKTARRTSGRTDYNSKSRYSRGESSQKTTRPDRSRERYSYDEIIFESRGDALEVQEMLEEIIDKYHMVSIADFYELSGYGEQSTYTDRKYGWYEFDGLPITRDRDGYHIKLPKPVAFD